MRVKDLFESYNGYRAGKHGIELYGGTLGMGARYDDKEEFLKMCLRELKGVGDHSEVKHWIKFCRKAGYDYPEFKAIEKSLGELREGLSEKNHGFYTIDKDTGKEVFIKYSDKHALIKYLLERLKRGDNGAHEVLWRIQLCREDGHEYPEFAAIEKSIGQVSESEISGRIDEGGPEDGITVYGDGHGEPDGIVKFKNREAFITLCLNELKNGSISEVKHWIRMCRGCGYDYPEFETIEKSIGKVPGKFTESLQGMPQWIYGEKIILKFSDKDKFLRELLKDLKSGELDKEDIKYWINQSRKAGHDYPEFKAIEKSIGK